jgi:hypothetical protein
MLLVAGLATVLPPAGSFPPAVALAPSGPPHGGGVAAGNGRLAFTTERRGFPDLEVYTARSDGSSAVDVSRNPAADTHPAWSPDGRTIAFASDRSGSEQIWAMNADGSGQRQLTAVPGHSTAPAWSPDGRRIAFSTDRAGDLALWVMNADGSGQQPVGNETGHDANPSWSPDGTRIVFDSSSRDHNCEIYVVGADGAGLTRLTAEPACDADPAWSPDGTTIAFRSLRSGTSAIWAMGADGSRPTRLTGGTAEDGAPAWSPDGASILFSRCCAGADNGLHVMGRTGAGARKVPGTSRLDTFADWQRRPAAPAAAGPSSPSPAVPATAAGAAVPAKAAGVPATAAAAAPATATVPPTPPPVPAPAPAPAAGAQAAAGGGVPTWSPVFMGTGAPPSAEEAATEARRFDLIAALPATYAGSAAAMRAANPALQLLSYVNAMLLDRNQALAAPEDWYARDATGSKIESLAYGNYLMDPSSPGWRAAAGSRCAAAISTARSDGCLLDVLGVAPIQRGYSTGVAVNRSTGTVWTGAGWLGATAGLASGVRSQVSPALAFGNGIENGAAYFDPTTPTAALVPALDGIMVESWARGARDPITTFRGEAAWKADVDMLADAEARGDPVLAVTKAWTAGTQAQKEAWHVYALASFLLGAGGRSRFSFLYDESAQSPRQDNPLWHLALGAPTAPYAKAQAGYYVRSFADGRVVVNPTTSSVTVPLGSTFMDLSCRPVSAITLAPHRAAVLRRSC